MYVATKPEARGDNFSFCAKEFHKYTHSEFQMLP